MIKHLYIHIPFCERICPYCDFNKRVSSDRFFLKYRDKLIEEIKENKNNLSDIETIYIGGGTPSFYPYIEDILKTIKEVVDLKKIKEYSIESTPGSINKCLNILNKYGINRVSIGIESLNNETLKYLKRENTNYEFLKEVVNSLHKENIFNINFDLIYGLPFETLDSIKKGLELIYKLNPTHISYYDLIIEENTILNYEINKGIINVSNEDLNIEMRDFIESSLEEHGYFKYEISNYAKRGYESIHNLAYWNNYDYLGLGLNSHSKVNNQRFNNSTNLKEYLDKNIIAYYDCNPRLEYLLMGLRKVEGVSINKYKELYNSDIFIDFINIKKHIDNGLLVIDNDYLKFTKNGMHLGNIVFEDLL